MERTRQYKQITGVSKFAELAAVNPRSAIYQESGSFCICSVTNLERENGMAVAKSLGHLDCA
jgi:hypothetical protein